LLKSCHALKKIKKENNQRIKISFFITNYKNDI